MPGSLPEKRGFRRPHPAGWRPSTDNGKAGISRKPDPECASEAGGGTPRIKSQAGGTISAGKHYLCPGIKRTRNVRTFYILLFWLIGNALSILTGGYVSGNIIGMILLFAALCLHWVKAETVRPAARFLLGAMALFFVPYGVGLMDSYRVILDNLWAIVISGIASTIIVLLVTGQTFQSLNRRSRLRRIRHLRETAVNTPDND